MLNDTVVLYSINFKKKITLHSGTNKCKKLILKSYYGEFLLIELNYDILRNVAQAWSTRFIATVSIILYYVNCILHVPRILNVPDNKILVIIYFPIRH